MAGSELASQTLLGILYMYMLIKAEKRGDKSINTLNSIKEMEYDRVICEEIRLSESRRVVKEGR